MSCSRSDVHRLPFAVAWETRKPMSPVTAAAMCRSSRAGHRSHQKGRCARTEENWSAARACTKQRQAGPGLRLRRCSTCMCGVGLARASAKKSPWRLAAWLVFIVKTGDFEAPVAVREKEGERLRGLTARTPTEGGVGRHTSRRRESDRPEGGSGPPRGQTTDRRGGPHEVGGVGTK